MPAKPDSHPFVRRIHALREQLETAAADAYVDVHLPNIGYLTGFTGSSGMFVLTPRETFLLTDSRYAIQAPAEVHGAKVRIESGALAAVAGALLRRSGRSRMRAAYAPSRMSVAQQRELAKAAGSRVRWVPREGLVEELRSVKDEDEVATMREAARLAEGSLAEVLKLVRPGVRENDLAAEIEFRMRKKGAAGASFETIVASGPRSALPHARPSEKRVGRNELVVFDLGAILRGYCSDLTRTVHVGRASARVRKWYNAVRDAQEAARGAIHPGAKAADVDAAARNVLRRSGLARYFVHGTGHGLGREVHEMPRLGRNSGAVLRAGQVVTLEPGVYVEGVGGIRIEDDVAIGAAGTESLTQFSHELLEI